MTVKELKRFLRAIPDDYTIVDACNLTEIIEQELVVGHKNKVLIYNP